MLHFTSILAAPRVTFAPASAYTANPFVAGFDVSSIEIVKAFPEVDVIVPPSLYIPVVPPVPFKATVPLIFTVLLYIPEDDSPVTSILLPLEIVNIPVLYIPDLLFPVPRTFIVPLLLPTPLLTVANPIFLLLFQLFLLFH